MTAVFKLEIPATQKLVLLAMADHAHNDGTGCYPSVGRLARKTSLSIRGVQTTLRRLEKAGFIVPQGKSKGGSGVTTEYNLTLQQGAAGALFAASPPFNRKAEKNPAPSAPFSAGEDLQRKGQNPAPQRSQTPHLNAENSALGAPEPSGTNFRDKIRNGCANPGRRQDAETREANATAIATAFSTLGFERPFGHCAFQEAVVRGAQELKNASLLEVMEGVIQGCHGKVPPRFYDAKHAIEDESRNTELRRASRAESNGHAASADSFSREQLTAYLVKNAERIERTAAMVSPRQPELGARCTEIAKSLRSSLALLDATQFDLEELEWRMSTLDEELRAALTNNAGQEFMATIELECEKQVGAYRKKIGRRQLALVKQQYIQKRLLEAFELPRMSLFYLG
jgi:hypothetical protein